MTTDSGVAVNNGSHSSAPDLDWSQIRETVRLLNLAVTHIEESMRVGDDSVDTLSDSFTTMAGTIQLIEKSIGDLPGSTECELPGFIEEQCHSLNEKVHQAIVAFQFYDRLVQKLTHVSHSLDALSELVLDQGRLYNPHEWTALQEKIRSRYTMESERLMFDALMNGATVHEALSLAKKHQDSTENESGDIDLF